MTVNKQALREAAQEEIMLRSVSDTSDAWQDEASPEAVLALLDELEAAEKRIAELEALTASMEQEPVAYMHHSGQVVTREECCDDRIFAICCKVELPLYAAPQLPQPAVLSVSEGVLKSLLPDVEKSEFWFEHNGKIFFEGVRFNNAVFEACRAAMQSFGNSEQLDEVGSWNNHMNTPTAQAGNSPLTPDGWQLVPKEPTAAMNKAGWDAINEHDAINPTYRAMLAAAPQQEVKSALEHGMQRYAGAMQKLSEGDK